MNRHRARHGKASRWDLSTTSGARRRSMSLHDVTAAPLDPGYEVDSNLLVQGPSLGTLDSLHKSRDSGLSRSASHLSCASFGHHAVASTPRRPDDEEEEEEDSCQELRKQLKQKEREIKEKDNVIYELKTMYDALFSEHQALKYRFAEYQVEVDKFRMELMSSKNIPQNFFSERQRSRSTDALSSRSFGRYTLDMSGSPVTLREEEKTVIHNSPSHHSQVETMSSATIVAGSSTEVDSGDEASDTPDDNSSCHRSPTLTNGILRPSPISLNARGSPVSNLKKPPTKLSQPLQVDIIHTGPIANWPPETLSPTSSSKWTLDKSMQLVSDSEMSEAEGMSPTVASMLTEESHLNCTPEPPKIRNLFHRELYLPGRSPVDQHWKQPQVLKLPEQSSVQKVQNWRDFHWTTWKEAKKRPQDLHLSSKVAMQRLHSPQNLSLLSPRPFQLHPTSNSAPIVVPPLDLSAIHSGSDSSRSTDNTSDSQSSVHSVPIQKDSLITLPSQFNANSLLRKAQKNVHLSKAMIRNLKENNHISEK